MYKYKAIDPSIPKTIGHIRDLIVDSNLYLSSPSDFNDPFDMTAKILHEGSMEDRLQRYQQMITDHAKDKNWKERRRMRTQFMTRSQADMAQVAKAAHTKTMQAAGVFSFAGDPRSIMMWSHYAKEHTGICLQFEIARDPRTMLSAIPVDYTNQYPIHNWIKNSTEELKRVLLAKFKAWEYEGERRIVIAYGARTKIPFLPQALVSVIFGVRATDNIITAVRELVVERIQRGLPPIRFYRATKHDSSYKLRIVSMT